MMLKARGSRRERRGRAGRIAVTAAAVVAVAGCGAVIGVDADRVKIPTAAGNYITRDWATLSANVAVGGSSVAAATAIDDARAYADTVAHFLAELDLEEFTGVGTHWDDMTQDYISDVAKWVDRSTTLTSNEWTRLEDVALTPVTTTGVAAASGTGNKPLETYVSDLVSLVNTAVSTNAGKIPAIREMIEKTVWDAVGYQAVLKLLSTAHKVECASASSTSYGTSTVDTQAYWDTAAAFLIGDGYHSVLGRAQKRGVEFGTLGGAGIAKPYEKIMKLLREGQEEADCDELHEIYEHIEKQMRVIYSQSILKYAYKIDKKIKDNGSIAAWDDDLAEGQAMYRVVAGDIYAKSSNPSAAVTFFNALFDVRSAPSAGEWDFANYCKAREYLVDAFTSTSAGFYLDKEMGTYVDAQHVDCTHQTNFNPAHAINTMAGDFLPHEYSIADDTYQGALKLSADVAHIYAELRGFTSRTSDWQDMSTDFQETYARWTESALSYIGHKSNEWDRMVGYPFPKPYGDGTYTGAAPLSSYIGDVVTLLTSSATFDGVDTAGLVAAGKEMIEKTMNDAVGFHAAINLLSKGQHNSAAHCPAGGSPTEAARIAWDTAAAILVGDGYHSVLGRAQKRGIEFGTMGAAHTAKSYETIMKLLRDGQEEDDCAALHEIYEGIEKQLRVVYAQGVLKYAFLIDKGLEAGEITGPYNDIVAEGQAMYRVIAGDIKDRAPTKAPEHTEAYKFFDDLFDVRKVPSAGSWEYANYCDSIAPLEQILKVEGLLGIYRDAHHVDCEEKTVYESSTLAELIKHAHTHGGVSSKEIRGLEVLAGFSFIIGLAGLIVGSISLHKQRRGGASAFKSSYVIQHV